jgi:hypothetical protein
MANPRKLASLLALSAGLVVLATDQPERPSLAKRLDFGTVELADATWLGSFEAATRAAAQQGKPILHFQMFGRLDDAYC